MTTFRATAPCRVDLAGGTLDLWPLSMLVEDAVTVNLAIDVMTSCRIDDRPVERGRWTFTSLDSGDTLSLRHLPRRPETEVPPALALAAVVASHFGLPPAVIETRSQAGRGSGLGGSSSLIIALIAAASAMTSRRFTDREAVELACNLETRVLGLPAGSQDHWAAQRGGASILEFGPEGVRHGETPHAAELGAALIVVDTLVEHHSGLNNWSVFRAFLEGDPHVRGALGDVGRAAAALRHALRSAAGGDDLLAAVRQALRSEWSARRRLSPAVTSPEVDRVIMAVESLGGAAKVCGAGGGGCVVCLPASLETRAATLQAVTAAGARVLPIRYRPDGVQVEIVED